MKQTVVEYWIEFAKRQRDGFRDEFWEFRKYL